MFCWWCANLSFWSAAGVLGLLFGFETVRAARTARRTPSFPAGGQAGQAAG